MRAGGLLRGPPFFVDGKAKKEYNRGVMIDTHAHINYPERYGDEEALFADLSAAGMERLIDVGWNYDSSLYAARQAERCPFVYFAAGFHPSNLDDFTEGDFERIAELLQSPKGVAVGEIGLDYHYENTDEEAQKRAFAAQMELAHACRLPFIVHSRDAAADTLSLLKQNKKFLEYGAVMHCFSGSPETAAEYLKLGLYISFAGPVTFKNARRLDEVAKIVPADRILAETDSPYLAPEPLRGTQNTPKNVKYVYEKLAHLRGVPLPLLEEQIRKNAYALFKKLNGTNDGKI